MTIRHFTGIAGAILILLVLSSTPARAVSWICGNGDLAQASCWSPFAPDASNSAVFNLGGSYLASLGATDKTWEVAGIYGDTVTWDIYNGRILTLQHAAGTSLEGLNVGVNSGDVGSLTIVSSTGDGLVRVAPNQATNIAQFAGSNGTLTIDDGGTLTTGNFLYVGKAGSGTLNVLGDGTLNSTNAILGYQPGSVGTATVAGSSPSEVATWNTSNLAIGGFSSPGGVGSLTIASNGIVAVTGGLTLWSGGTVNLTGGTLDVGSMQNLGTFNFSSGLLRYNSDLALTSGGPLGTSVTLGSGKTLELLGATTDLSVGDDVDAGTLDITGTGAVTVGGILTIYDGTVNLAGGTLDVRAIDSYGGAFNFSSGVLRYRTALDVGAGGPLGAAPVIGAGKTLQVTDGLTIGVLAPAALTISGGGDVSNTYGVLGYSDTGSATVTVDGAGSTWTNSSALIVGGAGSGTLNITNGGVVSNTNATVAEVLGSTGSVSVSGAGSRWTSTNLYVGGDTGAAGGSGSVTVGAGGLVETSGKLKIWSGGQANVSGGTVAVNETLLNLGTLTIDAGGVVSSRSVPFYLGNPTTSNGTVIVSGVGSMWTNSSDMAVGKDNGTSTSTLTIEAGGVVSAAYRFLGYGSGSGAAGTGTALVTGAGSKWRGLYSPLYVGLGEDGGTGTGHLIIEAGGVEFDDFAYVGLAKGIGSTGTGTALVTGAGSTWDSPWDINNGGGSLYLGAAAAGSYATGTLTIAAGGIVSRAEFVVIGTGSGTSTGTLLVTGAGSALVPNASVSNCEPCFKMALEVGTASGEDGNATGTLTIEAGGLVSSGIGRVGTGLGEGGLATGTGTVLVTGADSTWTNSRYLDVGGGWDSVWGDGATGTGNLTIEAGGVVSNGDARLGYGIGNRSTGTGTALVTGAGSRWTNSGSLELGYSSNGGTGTGTLSIEEGGTVSVGGLLKVSSAGSTVNLNGGTLTADTFENLGTFNFTSGTLNLGSLGIGTAGPLGSNYSLGAGHNLNVTNTTTIDAGSTLTINCGNFTTGSLVKNGTFQFLCGSIDLGTSALALGVGDYFVVGAGSSFTNAGTLSVAAGSSFLVNGGTLSAGAISLDGGAFAFTNGQLNLTNSDLEIGAGGLLGDNVVLDANRQVSVSGNVVLDGGSTLSLNGGNLVVGGILGINAGATVNAQGTINGGSVAVEGTLNLTGNTDILSSIIAIGDIFSGGGTGQINVADGTTTRFYGDVYASGTGIQVGAGGEAIYYGYLGGSGTLGGAGTHTAAGVVSPGNSPGLLTVAGDFVFENTATFLIEMNGLTPGANPGYDVLDISGDAWLDGTLQVTLLDGFTLTAGDSFDVLFAEVLHGTFGSSVLPNLSPDLVWSIQYLLNPTGTDTLRLTAQSAVPVPPAVWLFGSAIGLMGVMRRKISS